MIGLSPKSKLQTVVRVGQPPIRTNPNPTPTPTQEVLEPIPTSTPTPAISILISPSIATGRVGEQFQYQVEASNNPTEILINKDELPSGLLFNLENGIISGTPASQGVFNGEIFVVNDSGVSSWFKQLQAKFILDFCLFLAFFLDGKKVILLISDIKKNSIRKRLYHPQELLRGNCRSRSMFLRLKRHCSS